MVTDLLKMLAAHGGELLVEQGRLDLIFRRDAVADAERAGLIKFVCGSGWDPFEGYRLTAKGWLALGHDRPGIFERIKRLLHIV